MEQREIEWAVEALNDIDEVCAEAAEYDPALGVRAAERIQELVSPLRHHAFIGRVVPEYGDENLRERLMLREKYRILYRVKPDVIEIVGIFPALAPLPDEV